MDALDNYLQAMQMDAVFVRRTSDPVAGSVQGEAPDARLRGDGPRSDNLS